MVSQPATFNPSRAGASENPRLRRRRRYYLGKASKGPSMIWLALLGIMFLLPVLAIFLILFSRL
jgi:hypothetical protein